VIVAVPQNVQPGALVHASELPTATPRTARGGCTDRARGCQPSGTQSIAHRKSEVPPIAPMFPRSADLRDCHRAADHATWSEQSILLDAYRAVSDDPPPFINTATYPGASAGPSKHGRQCSSSRERLYHLLYLSSHARRLRRGDHDAYFRAGTNPDITQYRCRTNCSSQPIYSCASSSNRHPSPIPQVGLSVRSSCRLTSHIRANDIANYLPRTCMIR